MLGVRTVELGHSLSCCSLQNNSQWPWTGSEQPGEELLQHCLHFPVWTKNKQQTSIIPPPGQSAPVGSVPAFSRLCSSRGISHPGGRGWHIVPTSIGTWSPCPSPAETSCTPRLPSSLPAPAVPAWLCNPHSTQSSLGTRDLPVGFHLFQVTSHTSSHWGPMCWAALHIPKSG